MLDPNDDEAEKRIRAALERRSTRNLNEAMQELRDTMYPANRTFDDISMAYDEPARIHTAMVADQRLRDAIARMLLDGVDLGVSVGVRQLDGVGFGFDWTLANIAARDWAERYTDDLLNQLGTTTGRGAGQVVARWIENGEPLDALIRDLEPFFGPDRSERIAVTETTRAFAEGNRTAWKEAGIIQEMEWRTAMDERVCPICGALDGKRRKFDEAFDVGIDGPPAHPNCRCWIVPVVD